MKFKGLVIGLLTTVLIVNIFATYALIKEAKRQTAYQQVITKITLDKADYGVGYKDISELNTRISDAYKMFSAID